MQLPDCPALAGPLAEVVPIATIFLDIGLGAVACSFIGLSHRGMMRLVSGNL